MIDVVGPDTEAMIRARFAKRREVHERALATLAEEIAETSIRIAREEAREFPLNTDGLRKALSAALARVSLEQALLAALDEAQARTIAETAPVRAAWELAKREADAQHKEHAEKRLRSLMWSARARGEPSSWATQRDEWDALGCLSRDPLIDPALRKEAVAMISEGDSAALARMQSTHPHLFRSVLPKETK